jgi:hypothetical protein
MSSHDRVEVIRRALSDAETALEAVRKEMARLREDEKTLQAEVDGLRIALAAHEPPAKKESRVRRAMVGIGVGLAAVAEAQIRIEAWRALSRTDAIENVYAEVGKPLHRQELQRELRIRGREDTLGAISAALGYLQREGRADKLGGGRWVVHPRRAQPMLAAPAQPEGGGDRV